jgi:hypothetical protein
MYTIILVFLCLETRAEGTAYSYASRNAQDWTSVHVMRNRPADITVFRSVEAGHMVFLADYTSSLFEIMSTGNCIRNKCVLVSTLDVVRADALDKSTHSRSNAVEQGV